MKYFRKIATLILVLITVDISAQDLQKKMDSLMKKESFYTYLDKKRNEEYTCGWIEQFYGIPVFRNVQFDEATRVVTIEGITTMTGLPIDTLYWGDCPFNIIVARPDSKNNLRRIRRVGTTYCKDDDSGIKTGFFSVTFKILPNDILIIGNPGRAGIGSIAYNIWMLLKRK